MITKRFPRGLYAPESRKARIAPATIVVTSLLDNNGAGTTLREAVVAANLTATAVNLIATVIANNIAPTDPNRSAPSTCVGENRVASHRRAWQRSRPLRQTFHPIASMSSHPHIVEILESRIAPATFVVTSLADTVGGPDVTLRDAIASANLTAATDTIVFRLPAGSLPGTIDVGSDLLIEESLFIKGPGAGQLTLDGGKANHRIFDIENATSLISVSISGLTLTNGQVLASDGGAIRSTENLTLSAMLLQNNTASGNGGAVCVDTDGRFVMTSVQVLGNVADGTGGGIYAEATRGIVVNKSTIANNSADAAGGLQLSAGGAAAPATTILFDGNTVTGNLATAGPGGGARLDNDAISGIAKTIVRNSTFTSNSASNAGGGLSLNDGTAFLQNTVFAGNRATSGGGAVVDEASEALTISKSKFIGNSTTGTGGAVCDISDGRLSVIGSLFAGNVASNRGGAIILDAAGIDATLASNTFTGNSAGNEGGAIAAVTDSKLTVSKGSFTANTAGADGGAIFGLTTDGIVVTGAIFTGNRATADGGAICAGPGTPVTVTSAKFLHNSASDDGGAVAVEGAGALVVKSSSFLDNVAATLGGAIFRTSTGTLAVEGSLFQANAGGEGGGLATNGSGNVSVKTSRFLSNTATTGSGGGLYLELSAGVIDLVSLVISKNLANTDGGGVLIASGDAKTLRNSLLTGNVAATGEGGGLITTTPGSALAITRTKIIGNVAAIEGGGLRDDTGGVGFTGGTIVGNFAPLAPDVST